MKNSRHALSYCSVCHCVMVVCDDCGNNCCNGSTREINGKQCGCDEAYADQDAYWKNPNAIQFEKDLRDADYK